MSEENTSILPLKGERVLLADDMQLNQFVMGEMLRNCGVEAVFAKNGEEALQRASEQIFSIILLDILMPVMDGLEASRRIRQLDHPNAKVPIVAMTANIFDTDLPTYTKAGITATLVKPVDQQVLCQTLLSLIHPELNKNVATEKKNNQPVHEPLKIDLTYLEKVGKGNKEFIGSMLKSFHQTLESLSIKLEEFLLKKDIPAISDLLHQLKFPLGVVGLTVLTDRITKLENEAPEIISSFENEHFLQQVQAVLIQVKDLITQANDQLTKNDC